MCHTISGLKCGIRRTHPHVFSKPKKHVGGGIFHVVRRNISQKFLALPPQNIPGLKGGGFAKCKACHANSRGDRGVHWEPSAPPDAAIVTPATQSGGRCRQVPRLPRKVKADVAKCHACHANSRGDRGVHWEPSTPPEPA